MNNQAPARIGYERGFDVRFNDKVARTVDWLVPRMPSSRSVVGENGRTGRGRPRPRILSAERHFTETSRHPCLLTFLNAFWLGPANLLSALLDGLFELLL